MERVRVLFTGGSFNQTTQLWQVAQALPRDRFDVWFTPAYADGALALLCRAGLLEWTVLGRRLSERGLAFLRDRGALVDPGGRRGGYGLIVLCQDLIVPRKVRSGARLLLVQEGMTDPDGAAWRLWRRAPFLPRWVAGTATTGLSGAFDRFCVASEGYRDLFAAKGAPREKLVVTGIPNFDDCARYRRNAFPHHGYVLVCSSDSRETFKRHDRGAFLRRAVAIAAGRPRVWKLHPNEKAERATREIRAVAPGATVHATGSAEEMVANCEALVCEYSSLAYVGLALGKEVHSWFDLDHLRRLLPEQHGEAARRIARVACELVGVEPAAALPRTREQVA
jgi:hypothetical protein